MRRDLSVAYLLLTLTALIWASTIIAGRAVHDLIPPLTLNFMRWCVALAVVAPFGLKEAWKHRGLVARHWRIFTVLGLLNMTGFGSFLFLGLEHTQGINGSLLLGTMPVNIVAVSWLVTRERISRLQTIGVALAFAGLVVIVVRGDPVVLATLTIGIGDPLIWVSMVFYAFYSVYLPRAPQTLSLAAFMTIVTAVGVAACLPLYVYESQILGRKAVLTVESGSAVLYVGVFSSLLAQIFWIAGINRVGANTAGYFIYLAPVFGTFMALTLLGETFRWFHAAGIALVFSGVYLATRFRAAATETGERLP